MLLEGWKNIAYYLRVSERTAQTWYQTRGLPITYIGGRVVADSLAIDDWKAVIDHEKDQNARKAITVRLKPADYRRLKVRLIREPNATMQDFVARAIDDYLNHAA